MCWVITVDFRQPTTISLFPYSFQCTTLVKGGHTGDDKGLRYDITYEYYLTEYLSINSGHLRFCLKNATISDPIFSHETTCCLTLNKQHIWDMFGSFLNCFLTSHRLNHYWLIQISCRLVNCEKKLQLQRWFCC